jgi:hypothetical protein
MPRTGASRTGGPVRAEVSLAGPGAWEADTLDLARAASQGCVLRGRPRDLAADA